MTEYVDYPSLNPYPVARDKGDILDWAQRLKKERELDRIKWNNLKDVLVRGRLRNGSRAEPSSSSDVVAADNQYDWYLSATNLWVLIDDGGLEWKSIPWGGGGGGSYLPLAGGTMTGYARGPGFVGTDTTNITYSGDNINTITYASGRTVTFTYSGDDIDFWTDGTNTWTVTYDGGGNITDITVT